MTAHPALRLPLTGQRTVPGLAAANYWFRRHDVGYQQRVPHCAGAVVLEAGCGEGYGADLVAECVRVLRPGGWLLLSTPNRLTFSPGRDRPLNPFHSRELCPAELAALLGEAGFDVEQLQGLRHGPRLRAVDTRHGGSVVYAQVAGVQCMDFELSTGDLDAGLDPVAAARRRPRGSAS
jgi:hypothetical protein